VSAAARDWAGVVLICACAALAALVEALLVPLYAGKVIVPIAVVLAIGGNFALPRMARTLVASTAATLAPLLVWLAVVLLLLYGRPEGDVAFPGQPAGVAWVFYGTLFGGALSGVAAIATSVPAPPGRDDVSR
jgi:hypothetical protein